MKKLLLAAVILASFGASASSIDSTQYDWEDDKAITELHIPNKGNQYASAKVGMTVGGNQRVFFYWEIQYTSSCNPSNYGRNNLEEVTYTINGQNVRMVESCNEFQDSSGEYTSAGALTDAGQQFIVNEFKRKNVVHVKFGPNGGAVNFSAKGFTKAWNNGGGDAL